MRNITMDDALKASFGETGSSIRATFKKTVNVKQYETESVEVSSTLEIDKDLTGVERMLISAILQSQLEYEAYIQLVCKGTITASEFEQRKKSLEQDMTMLANKAEEILGKPVDYLFDMIPKEDGTSEP